MQNNQTKNKTIPVFILTGFLGAGKTTTLNHILSLLSGYNNVVIENEFGKTAIDTILVKKTYSDIYELTNGCICCNLDEDLYNILLQIERNEKRPDFLFLETTGVADAGNVAAIFTRQDVQKVFDLKKIVCIVDTENIEELMTEVPETVRQLVASDLIVLNKTDILSEVYTSEIKQLIKSVNPFADITTSLYGAIHQDDLFTENKQPHTPQEPIKNSKHKCGHHCHSSHNITSVTFSTGEAFDLKKLRHALTVTLFLHYKQIYRIKGIIKTHNSDKKILVQSVGRILHTESIGEWYGDNDNPQSVIVIIGVGLKKEFIERICRATFYTSKNVDLI